MKFANHTVPCPECGHIENGGRLLIVEELSTSHVFILCDEFNCTFYDLGNLSIKNRQEFFSKERELVTKYGKSYPSFLKMTKIFNDYFQIQEKEFENILRVAGVHITEEFPVLYSIRLGFDVGKFKQNNVVLWKLNNYCTVFPAVNYESYSTKTIYLDFSEIKL